jgi:hypothetical protein
VTLGLAYLAWAFVFGWSQSTPAYMLDLDGTTWSASAIDNVPLIGPRPVLSLKAYEVAVDTAEIALACGVVPLGWSYDTDGAGIQLWHESLPKGCESPSAQDAAVLKAITSIQSWSFQGDDNITLLGTYDIRLDRLP